jgi:nicotinate phosphoribosyltransferase
MAHSYVLCFAEEIDAFRAFAATYPQHTVLLIDTYDTLTGARRAAVVGQEMAQRGQRLLGVRLDSGDMTALSKAVRAILDSAGLPEVQIVASGGFDEYAIAQALQDGARIDQFGVGTRMGVAAAAPYYDMAYKLVQYDGRPVMKLSAGKATLVEAKQIWRRLRHGQYVEDLLALRHEAVALPQAQPLLRCVMRAGQVVQPRPTLAAVRALHAGDMARLRAAYRLVQGGERYAVRLSAGLAACQQQVEATLRRQAEAARVGT